jgi:hypothetical protein
MNVQKTQVLYQRLYQYFIKEMYEPLLQLLKDELTVGGIIAFILGLLLFAIGVYVFALHGLPS